jgi:type IV pilus assembly protein PilY1
MTAHTSTVYRSGFQKFTAKLMIMLIGLQPLVFSQANAAPPATSGLVNLFDAPYLAGQNIPPYVMLTMTKDQQLFKKAYDDFSDLDGDGNLDTSYKHSVKYYGYFDARKCYVYNGSNRRFEPSSITTDGYCTNKWSGNFLNWSTMTRIDALRKVLFGGLRSPNRDSDGGDGAGLADGDTDSSTVLERSFLPTDAHAFSKYYNGADLNKLTPFTAKVNTYPARVATWAATNWTTNQNLDSSAKTLRVPNIANSAGFWTGDAVQLSYGGEYLQGVITETPIYHSDHVHLRVSNISERNSSGFLNSAGVQKVNPSDNWTVTNLSRQGITICNATDGGSGIQSFSNTNTNLPKMRIASGNYSLWNAAERWQCVWQDQRWGDNLNNFPASGIPAYQFNPRRGGTDGVDLNSPGKASSENGGDHFVRVQACVAGLIGEERCEKYPNGNVKPAGLLQKFGESDRIRFGLITGSYQKNISGGVLRKNVGKIDDEIDANTGIFKVLGTDGVGTSVSQGNAAVNVSGGSLIKTLGILRMMGYNYDSGDLFNNYGNNVSNTNDPCSYQTELDLDGKCKSWGNPISEMYYETLRYFGGRTQPTNDYDADDTTVRADLAKATWPTSNDAVLSEKNYCAPLNALVINSATSTNENDNQINNLNFMDGSPGSVAAITTAVGEEFGLTGTYYYGQKASDGPTTPGYRSCTAKTLTGLGDVVGICPEGPTYGGTFKIAGLAYHAHTNAVNKVLASKPSVAARIADGRHKRKPLHMDTFTVSLSSGVPRIPIKFAGETEPRATLQPAYRLILPSGQVMGGALVDLRVLSQVEAADSAKGRLMVSWEDSEGGGDYDMDMWGIISYEMTRSGTGAITLKVTTDAVAELTANPQGFGYTIAGTTADGQHYHSGIHNFTYAETSPNMNVTTVGTGAPLTVTANGSCNSCNVGDPATTATYSITATPPAKSLQEPLYYAAIFGGFDNRDNTNKPGSEADRTKYDSVNNSTGAQGADGIPDNFFKVANPGGLEASLERAFQNIADQSSLTNVASASTRVRADNRIYEAKFNSGDWSGNLVAKPTDSKGLFITAGGWDAADFLRTFDQNSRVVISTDTVAKTGIPFRWSSLSSAQKSMLNTNTAGTGDTLGASRVDYLRGSAVNEGSGTNQFRTRSSSKLGDIVNSNPVYVGKPNGGLLGDAYRTFAATTRTPVVYVGSNDGMLHGFNANTGKEVLAYVPGKVYNGLSHITSQQFIGNHKYTVDGQIGTQDVEIGGAWKTYLVGGLGKGGQGVYALDITDPSQFSEANAASIAKWEFTDKDDPALGYVYSEPVIRKLANGRWAALVSSGYNATQPDGSAATDGTGHLFVLFLEGPTGADKTWVEGTDYVKIPLGSDASTAPNHVGGVATWDRESNGIADLAYLGDTKGRMWRIELKGASPSTWTTKAKVIFKAEIGSKKQPITAAPVLTNGPLYQGVLVMFGTGRLAQQADLVTADYETQSMYGVLDRVGTRTTPIERSELMAQRPLASETKSGTDFALLSSYVPNYTSSDRTNVVYGTTKVNATGPTETTNPQLGWLLDMPDSKTTGERSIYSPITSGDLLVFANAVPSAVPCDGGGDEARYALSMLSGGRYWKGGFDTNADNDITLADRLTFGGFSTSGSGEAEKFFASRRLKKGGFGQISALELSDKTAQSPDGICVRALAYSTSGERPEALPGGCVNRVQWRESLVNGSN